MAFGHGGRLINRAGLRRRQREKSERRYVARIIRAIEAALPAQKAQV